MQNGHGLVFHPDTREHSRNQRLKRKPLLVLISLVLLFVAGCDTDPGNTSPTSSTSQTSTPEPSGLLPSVGSDPEITDPLSEITDKNNERYIDEPVTPLLHARDRGPSEYSITADEKTVSVRVYVACAPESPFTVDVGKSFSGECAGKFQNFADIPVRPGGLEIELVIPEDTQFVVLVIPTPTAPPT